MKPPSAGNSSLITAPTKAPLCLALAVLLALSFCIGAHAAPRARVRLPTKSCQSSLTTASDSSIVQTKPLNIASIRIEYNYAINREQGRYDGQRIVMATYYGSINKVYSGPNQGDVVVGLNYLSLLMGENEADFFGFEGRASGRPTVPDINEINGANRRFNRRLPPFDPRRILISFYPTESAFGTAVSYRRRFMRYFQLPIATKGRQFLHDIVTHGLQGFFLPNSMLELMRDRFQIWEDFVNHMKQAYPNLLPERLYDEMDEVISLRINGNIDKFTNFTGAFHSPISRFQSASPAHEALSADQYADMVKILYTDPLTYYTSMFARGDRMRGYFSRWYKGYAKENKNLTRPGIKRDDLVEMVYQLQVLVSKYRSPSEIPLSVLKNNEFARDYAERLKRLRRILEHQTRSAAPQNGASARSP